MYYFDKVSRVKPRANIQTRESVKPEQPKVQTKADKEISHAAKYMIGATALAATVAFGILMRKKLKRPKFKPITEELKRPLAQRPQPIPYEKPPMEPTPRAQWIYDKTERKLHATNPLIPEKVDKNTT